MDMHDITDLMLMMPLLIAEEDSRSLEVSNYTEFNKETQRKIKARLDRPFAQTVSPKNLMG